MERKYYDLTAAQNILFSQKYTIIVINNVCTSCWWTRARFRQIKEGYRNSL